MIRLASILIALEISILLSLSNLTFHSIKFIPLKRRIWERKELPWFCALRRQYMKATTPHRSKRTSYDHSVAFSPSLIFSATLATKCTCISVGKKAFVLLRQYMPLRCNGRSKFSQTSIDSISMHVKLLLVVAVVALCGSCFTYQLANNTHFAPTQRLKRYTLWYTTLFIQRSNIFPANNSDLRKVSWGLP